MKFGAMLVYEGLSDPDYLNEVGIAVEQLGFDSLWLADHVVIPTDYESVYPYNASGKVTTVPFPEPLVSLAFLAAATSTIELGTAVLILPQRQPVLLAKQAVTLDRLANGRLNLGVGIGWLREEFQALDVAFENRGARTDEYIDVMRALWSQDKPMYPGKYASLNGSYELRPRPISDKGVRITIGGHSPAAATRAAKRGDGFFPFLTDPTELDNLFEVTRQAALDNGRNPADIELMAPTTTEPDCVPKLRDIGVAHAIMPGAAYATDIEALKAKLGRFSDRVIAKAT